ncbi:MAG: alpha/beta fold hydrolase [Deltaproteobacteria bacterium]|jgi:uncharacterized protein|nr:alpha/beta fold hydrolase [Deltaproteobacteria bacterium]
MESFKPPIGLASPYTQTIISSSSMRTFGRRRWMGDSQQSIELLPDNVRLECFYSPPPISTTHHSSLFILLHGWEGSAHSSYIVHMTDVLLKAGFHVLRYNMRDHGNTHHLNEGVFYGTLLKENIDLIKLWANRFPDFNIYLIGFSLGGNFTLRILNSINIQKVPNLKSGFVMNPALDPKRSTIKIDQIGVLKWYFLKKWKISLRKKMAAFPNLYQFQKFLNIDSCMGLTEILLKYYSEFSDCQSYFNTYTIKIGHYSPQIPVKIITAKDDPIIEQELFDTPPTDSKAEIIVLPKGGHCGYISNYKLESWYHRYILDSVTGHSFLLPEYE